jgi:ABC-type antimicrobial peptide transport system permease subunit
MQLAFAGLALGALLVVPIVALLRADLHGVAPIEPLGLLAGAAIVLAATATATYLPARRVTRVAPVESLRAD